MQEYMDSIQYQPHVDKFRDTQIAQRSTWNSVPDASQFFASMHSVTVVPKNFSTVTYVNPMDPGDREWVANDDCGWGDVIPAGRL